MIRLNRSVAIASYAFQPSLHGDEPLSERRRLSLGMENQALPMKGGLNILLNGLLETNTAVGLQPAGLEGLKNR